MTSDWLNHCPIPKTQTVVVVNSTDLEVPLWSFKRESLNKDASELNNTPVGFFLLPTRLFRKGR